MYNNFSKIIAGLVLAGNLAATSANAAVIDFESATTGGCTAAGPASISGFTLTDGAFNNATACSFIAPTANSGEQYMLNHRQFDGELTKNSGTFTLDSLWVHADLRNGQTTVRFQGLDGIGGNILNMMDVVIGAFWQEVVFSGWNNIKTFTWDPISPTTSNIAIDDFTYNTQLTPLPEPAPLALLGLGLLGLGMARKRRS